jgi:hypothetical protein
MKLVRQFVCVTMASGCIHVLLIVWGSDFGLNCAVIDDLKSTPSSNC